jgi:hypothetical protein
MVSPRDAGMRRPAVGDRLTRALHGIVEAETSAAHVAAGGTDRQSVVETRGVDVTRVRLERQRVDPFFPQSEVAASEAAQVLDPRRLEPNEIGRVVRDALGVGLGKADDELGREVELGHGA